MDTIKVFQNEQFDKVRVTELNGMIWFVGKDVAEILGYENPTKAIRDHVDDEDRMMGVRNVTFPVVDAFGREQYPTWINESGFYSLIMSSKLPTARQFKRWVTKDVLPAIHEHGMCATPLTIDQIIADPDYGIQLLNELKNQQENNRADAVLLEK